MPKSEGNPKPEIRNTPKNRHAHSGSATAQAEISIEKFEIFATGIDHPECVAFDRQGDLWAGGEVGQIYRIPPDGKAQLIASLGGFCGGLAFSPRDELFVCNPSLGVV